MRSSKGYNACTQFTLLWRSGGGDLSPRPGSESGRLLDRRSLPAFAKELHLCARNSRQIAPAEGGDSSIMREFTIRLRALRAVHHEVTLSKMVPLVKRAVWFCFLRMRRWFRLSFQRRAV